MARETKAAAKDEKAEMRSLQRRVETGKITRVEYLEAMRMIWVSLAERTDGY